MRGGIAMAMSALALVISVAGLGMQQYTRHLRSTHPTQPSIPELSSRDAVGFAVLSDRDQHQNDADKGQEGGNAANPISIVGRASCVFGSDSRTSFNTQIGLIVVSGLSAVYLIVFGLASCLYGWGRDSALRRVCAGSGFLIVALLLFCVSGPPWCAS